MFAAKIIHRISSLEGCFWLEDDLSGQKLQVWLYDMGSGALTWDQARGRTSGLVSGAFWGSSDLSFRPAGVAASLECRGPLLVWNTLILNIDVHSQ